MRQNVRVSSTFPRIRTSRLGYDIDQVEDFLEEARRAYSADPSEPTVVTAESIRRMAFGMQKGGYAAPQVDAALERLEDAFANRERERTLAAAGEAGWYADARGTAQEILDRLVRDDGRKFTRVGRLSQGYHPDDVDAFARELTAYFQDGRPLTVAEVRTVAFRPKRGGYREAQVDLLLDHVIGVMLAVS